MFKEKKMKIGREQNPDWGHIAEQCLITAVPRKKCIYSVDFIKQNAWSSKGKFMLVSPQILFNNPVIVR